MAITLATWTLADYHQMIVAGILDDRPVELLNGEIVNMSPEGPEHAYLGETGGDYLALLLGQQATVRRGHPVTLPHQSEPEPDLAIVQPLGAVYRDRHPYPEDIFWVIELANTSLAKDLHPKRELYATAGIPEYWVINLQAQSLVRFWQPVDGTYQRQQTLQTGTIYPVAFPDIAVSVSAMLGRSS